MMMASAKKKESNWNWRWCGEYFDLILAVTKQANVTVGCWMQVKWFLLKVLEVDAAGAILQ